MINFTLSPSLLLSSGLPWVNGNLENALVWWPLPSNSSAYGQKKKKVDREGVGSFGNIQL